MRRELKPNKGGNWSRRSEFRLIAWCVKRRPVTPGVRILKRIDALPAALAKGNRETDMKIKIALLVTVFLFAVLGSASTALPLTSATGAQARPEKPLNQAAAEAAELTIRERQAGGVTILDLEGKITDGGGTVALRKAIRGLLDEGKRKILLNFKWVSDVSESGIDAMVAGFNATNAEDGLLKLLNISDSLRDVLWLGKLLTVFETFDNEAKALNSY